MTGLAGGPLQSGVISVGESIPSSFSSFSHGKRCEGLAARSDGRTVFVSHVPMRWEEQASMLQYEVTLAGAQHPGHGCGGFYTCCWR